MNILYEDSMPYGEAFLSDLGNCRSFSHKTLSADDLTETDILLVRSTTKVNASLLSKANALRFVSTATAGTNHMDLAYLNARGIQASSAAGCNAVAVAEYVLSALIVMAQKHQWNLQDKTVGIVGAGQVGTRLSEKLTVLGIVYKLCDPPLENQGDKRDFVSFDEVMDCDIISLHVPLIDGGTTPTRHLVDASRLSALNDEQLLINACRGEVVDNDAALALFRQGKNMNLVLDVWENEPGINLELLPYIALATAHIAGHTIEGKARGTEMLYQQVCALLGRPIERKLTDYLPKPERPELLIDEGMSLFEQCQHLILNVYDIRKDDEHFRQNVVRPGQFEYIRKHYAIRREFAAIQVKAGNCAATEAIYQLGFARPE